MTPPPACSWPRPKLGPPYNPQIVPITPKPLSPPHPLLIPPKCPFNHPLPLDPTLGLLGSVVPLCDPPPQISTPHTRAPPKTPPRQTLLGPQPGAGAGRGRLRYRGMGGGLGGHWAGGGGIGAFGGAGGARGVLGECWGGSQSGFGVLGGGWEDSGAS